MLDLDAYLERIGLNGRPSIAQVHRARLTSIPFENLDAIADALAFLSAHTDQCGPASTTTDARDEMRTRWLDAIVGLCNSAGAVYGILHRTATGL
ncbi:MAG: hypothetical protein WB709_08450 [Solirubrobacteraceae bacterium]